MQTISAKTFERDAARLLPSILGELLDEDPPRFESQPIAPDSGIDILATDNHGRSWAFELRLSGRPGIVAAAAEPLTRARRAADLVVLVVPYMTSAGAKAAQERRLNWVDLSGNAHVRSDKGDFYLSVWGKPNRFPSRGRPSSAFAPKSARVARAMLLDPTKWWRQKDLAASTRLDDGHVSRLVRRLKEDRLLEVRGNELRPADPDVLLDAWDEEYRFDRHEIVLGHRSGSGIDLARDIGGVLADAPATHAFTGLPAAWLLAPFARFRLVTLYVLDDPHEVADRLEMSRDERGANVQIVAPNDEGLLDGIRMIDGLPCVSPVQVYLDLRHLPERASEAAEDLRTRGMLWNATRR